jgi:uncharacterized membrane protein YqjE
MVTVEHLAAIVVELVESRRHVGVVEAEEAGRSSSRIR